MLTDTPAPPASQPAEAPPQLPGSDAPPVAEVSSPAEAPQAQEAPKEPAAEPTDPLAGLDAHDPETLLEKHPGLKRLLDSRAGEVGDRLAKRREAALREQVRAELAAEAEQRRLDEAIASDDALAVAEIVKTRREREKSGEQATAQEARVANGVWSEVLSAPVQHYLSIEEKAVKDKLSGKSYADKGSPVGQLQAYYSDYADAKAEHAVELFKQKELPRLEAALRKSLEPVIRKEVLGEVNGSEPSAETGGGGAPVGAITRAMYEQNKHNSEWLDKHGDEAARQAARGWA